MVCVIDFEHNHLATYLPTHRPGKWDAIASNKTNIYQILALNKQHVSYEIRNSTCFIVGYRHVIERSICSRHRTRRSWRPGWTPSTPSSADTPVPRYQHHAVIVSRYSRIFWLPVMICFSEQIQVPEWITDEILFKVKVLKVLKVLLRDENTPILIVKYPKAHFLGHPVW